MLVTRSGENNFWPPGEITGDTESVVGGVVIRRALAQPLAKVKIGTGRSRRDVLCIIRTPVCDEQLCPLVF